MSRLPTVSSRRMCRVLETLGFKKIRQKGSHAFYQHPDGRATVVLIHKGEELGRGLVASILCNIDIGRDEFVAML